MITIVRRWLAVACLLATDHDQQVEHLTHELDDTKRLLGEITHELAVEKARRCGAEGDNRRLRADLALQLEQAVSR